MDLTSTAEEKALWLDGDYDMSPSKLFVSSPYTDGFKKMPIDNDDRVIFWVYWVAAHMHSIPN